MPKGRILKALSGFYYVEYEGVLYQARGRGRFRNEDLKPLVGDIVEFQIENETDGYLLEIDERKNELVRPPVANIDQVLVVTSCKDPLFSTNLLDRFLALIEFNNIIPVIIITKYDLLNNEEKEIIDQYITDYKNIGYQVIIANNDLDSIKYLFENKISVLAGQSGAGKSSLLNVLDDTLNIKTDETSKALGRGKHTTRHVELIQMFGGYVADTPGFSSLEFYDMDLTDLAHSFRDFFEASDDCKYRGCLHINEPKCKIKENVDTCIIPKYRYENYLKFVEEIKNRKVRY